METNVASDLDVVAEDLGAAELLPVDVRWPLNIIKAERTIFELHRRWRAGSLQLAPDFQREFVWSDDKQVKLVESVMARIPLPVFYLSDESEEELLVVDGQQRLTTLFAFMEGRFAEANEDAGPIRRREGPSGGRPFALRRLRLLKELDGKEFTSMEVKLQRRFEETPLTCFVIQAGTHADVKFELFERINEGSAPLVAQEIRNALYRGPGLDLIKRLAAPQGRFREVAGADRSYAHMRADELVLRAVTFIWRGLDDYKGDLKQYLNETLAKLNALDSVALASIERRFLHAVEVVHHVFGGHAWQRHDKERGAWAGHLSGPLLEAMSYGLDRAFRDALPTADQAEQINREFVALCEDSPFAQAILTATQTSKNVVVRMKRFEEVARRAQQLQP